MLRGCHVLAIIKYSRPTLFLECLQKDGKMLPGKKVRGNMLHVQCS